MRLMGAAIHQGHTLHAANASAKRITIDPVADPRIEPNR